jgi:hypothetical protein
MRAVDRNLADLPDVAIQLFKVLWPGEEVPASLTLTSECLKGAGRRIREWQCSAARARADAALRVASPGMRTWTWTLSMACAKMLPPIRIRSSPPSGRIVPTGLRSTPRSAPSSPLLPTSRTTLATKKKVRTRKIRMPEQAMLFQKVQRPVLLLLKLLLLKHLL